jgi:hypothetical protein
MVLTFGYNWLNVGKNFNLYPNFVLEWVLSEMLVIPLLALYLYNSLSIILFTADCLLYDFNLCIGIYTLIIAILSRFICCSVCILIFKNFRIDFIILLRNYNVILAC